MENVTKHDYICVCVHKHTHIINERERQIISRKGGKLQAKLKVKL